MSKLLIGFLGVIVLSGLIDVKADAALINEVSYLFIGDTGYVAERVDMDYIEIYDNGMGSKTADIYGGFIGTVGPSFSSTVNLYAGVVEHIRAVDSSTVNIFDGSLVTLSSHDSSNVNIFGGVFEDYDVWSSVHAFDYSQVSISGGKFADKLSASHNSVITIYGTDFVIDGFGVGYGEIAVPSGILAGTLASGETINNNFHIYEDATIVLVPEPSTLLLLCLGAVILRRQKKYLQ